MDKINQGVNSNREGHQSEWTPLFSEFLDGRLDPFSRLKVEHHLARCVSCYRDFLALQFTIKSLKNLPQVKPLRSFGLTYTQAQALRPQPRTLFRAVSFACALAAALLLFTLALDFAGVFDQSGTFSTQASTSPTIEVPLVGTRPPVTPCPQTGLNCALGGLGTQVVSEAAPSETSPVNRENSAEFSVIHIMELSLGILLVVTGIFAYILRPRATGTLRW